MPYSITLRLFTILNSWISDKISNGNTFAPVLYHGQAKQSGVVVAELTVMIENTRKSSSSPENMVRKRESRQRELSTSIEQSHGMVGLQHDRSVRELLAWGTQYITRKMISKAFVRTIRPSIFALVLKQIVLVKLPHQPAAPHMRSSLSRPGTFWRNHSTAPHTVGLQPYAPLQLKARTGGGRGGTTQVVTTAWPEAGSRSVRKKNGIEERPRAGCRDLWSTATVNAVLCRWPSWIMWFSRHAHVVLWNAYQRYPGINSSKLFPPKFFISSKTYYKITRNVLQAITLNGTNNSTT